MDDSIVVKPQTLSKGRLWTALVAILLGQFVVAIDLTVLNIALPELTRDLSPSSDQLLWIVDVYSLVLAGFLVATSSLSDRFGRKKMLLAGFLIFGIGSVLVVFINDASQLIAIRAFLGIGGAMIMPITISMIRSIFTDSKERAIAVAAWSAISAIGMAAGPLIGGFLLEHFNWHSAFLVNVPIVGVAFLLGVLAMPEVKLKNPGRFDVLGSVLALAAMVALLWGIKHLAAELAFDVPGVAATVAGLVLIALFIYRCLKSPHPIVDLSLFRSRTFSAGVIATHGVHVCPGRAPVHVGPVAAAGERRRHTRVGHPPHSHVCGHARIKLGCGRPRHALPGAARGGGRPGARLGRHAHDVLLPG